MWTGSGSSKEPSGDESQKWQLEAGLEILKTLRADGWGIVALNVLNFPGLDSLLQ